MGFVLTVLIAIGLYLAYVPLQIESKDISLEVKSDSTLLLNVPKGYHAEVSVDGKKYTFEEGNLKTSQFNLPEGKFTANVRLVQNMPFVQRVSQSQTFTFAVDTTKPTLAQSPAIPSAVLLNNSVQFDVSPTEDSTLIVTYNEGKKPFKLSANISQSIQLPLVSGENKFEISLVDSSENTTEIGKYTVAAIINDQYKRVDCDGFSYAFDASRLKSGVGSQSNPCPVGEYSWGALNPIGWVSPCTQCGPLVDAVYFRATPFSGASESDSTQKYTSFSGFEGELIIQGKNEQGATQKQMYFIFEIKGQKRMIFMSDYAEEFSAYDSNTIEEDFYNVIHSIILTR